MKSKVIKNGFEWPEKAIKDLMRIGEDVQTLIDGENESVVITVLMNLLIESCIKKGVSKESFIELVGNSYNHMTKQFEKNE